MFNLLKGYSDLLGINKRNLKYIKPSNSQRALRIADNKLLNKRFLVKYSLPVAKTYAVIKGREELNNFDWSILPKSFVLKPNRGMGGEGILIVYGKKRQKDPHASPVWVQADRSKITIPNLYDYVLNILDGKFSRNQLPDVAIFEERLKLLRMFKPYAFRGVPDIRIIVYNSVPVMAELRLPTKESQGRSNLHLGGVGAGIDMATGLTIGAIWHGKLIKRLPGTKVSLLGIKIPKWKTLLELAIESQKATGIGFLGVDIGIDREKGPVILELNARPGLSIQTANLASLNSRLKKVAGLEIKSIKQAVRLSQDLFGGQAEQELEELSGRKIIGIKEKIQLIDNQGEKYEVVAKIDTGAYRTSICKSLAKKLGITETIKYKKVRSSLGKKERRIVDLSFILDKKRVSTEAFVADRRKMKYDLIVGRKDLKKFLVDPAKNILIKK